MQFSTSNDHIGNMKCTIDEVYAYESYDMECYFENIVILITFHSHYLWTLGKQGNFVLLKQLALSHTYTHTHTHTHTCTAQLQIHT